MSINQSKFSVILLLLFAASFSAFAQKEYQNSISITSCGFKMPHLYNEFRYSLPLNEQFGIYYERKIWKKYIVTVGYQRWNDRWASSDVMLITPFQIRESENAETSGALIYREQYAMFDAFFKYRLKISKRSEVKAGVGLSYTSGINTYFDSIVLKPFERWDYNHKKREGYFGIVPTLSYDYSFFRNRIFVGADLRYRKYFGLYSSQIDYGVHVGCNF